MRLMRYLLFVLIVLAAACTAEETPLPSPTLTPRPRRTAVPTQPLPPTPTVQVISTAAPQTMRSPLASPLRINTISPRRVLFVQGDHIPENGYPHSRVRDDGSHPESFTHLRSEILERDLQLSVDEWILGPQTTLTLSALSDYALIVLGSNARPLYDDEVTALVNYYLGGGSILTYADFQYGPQNWNSDNGLLQQFGLNVFSDNFQPTTRISDVLTTHPVMNGVRALQVEGISQLLITANAPANVQVLAQCLPQNRPGCILPPPDSARLKANDRVACVVAIEHTNGGRLASVCDRNLFQNGPGPGSDLDQADNRLFAQNLFAWLAHE